MLPIFSVIIVTFKRIELLKKAIESVLSQKFTQYECFIFNDNPSDNEQIAKLVSDLNDARFHFFSCDVSKGANHWRNRGVKMAKGDFIAFLDDDDIWFPDKLMEHYKAHTQQEAFVVYSDYIKTWPEKDRPDIAKVNSIIAENIQQEMEDGNFSISTTSSVSLKNKIDWELFDESLLSFQDWDAWFNLAILYPKTSFFRIEKPLLFFIQHESNRTSQNYDKRFHALRQLKRKYQVKGIDISGFFYKEKLNLTLMKIKDNSTSKISANFYLLYTLILNLSYFKYKYTYKRIGRYLFKENLV